MIKCQFHNKEIVKIQQPSLRPLCIECLTEDENARKQRIDAMHRNLSKLYEEQKKALQQEKANLVKIVELFVNKNMVEAKKIVNRKSFDSQKIVDDTLEKSIAQADAQMLAFLESELARYKGIENQQLTQDHLNFDQDSSAIQQRLTAKKQEIKAGIASKLKAQMRQFYQNLFQL